VSDLPKFVGPFEIRDRLGHGGMGMVYLGYDPMLDRPVAVKVLRVPDDETRRRFLREARLHAKVQHPHIVNIYAVGEHEGQPYLAMEYIAGSTLAAIIRSGEDVPLARKVSWLAELSAGLDHAHRFGIVHRDVKPSNILVTRETGRLRLLDFGIAHGQEAMGMTMAGMVIGTPQYMSPEQITGKPVDARSDIFSVGLVGYELLTGKQAFGGDNVFDISRRIVSEPPAPLASACRTAPVSLLRIVEKCLEKAPEARYQDARQLERELMSVARRLDPDHTLMSVPLTAPTAVVDSQSDGNEDPSTAAAALAVRVREAVAAGQLAEAEQLLRDLRARHARVPGLSGLRVLVEEARQMSQAVELARDAERALGQTHLTEAQALIDDIERLAPNWSGLAPLRRQLQALQNERRIADVVRRISASLEAGQLDAAEPALRELAALAPAHPELTGLRSRYHARIAHQQAASLASRARVALQQDQLDDAAALVAEALAIAPGNEDALSVQELVGQRRRAQRVARAAQKVVAAIDAGQPVSARKALDQLQRMDALHPDLESLQHRVERLERGEEPDTTSGLPSRGSNARQEAPAVVTADAAPSSFVAPPPLAVALATPGGSSGAIALDDDDDDLRISRADLPTIGGERESETDVSTAGTPRWVLPAAAVLVVALAAGGYWFLWPAGAPVAVDTGVAAVTAPGGEAPAGDEAGIPGQGTETAATGLAASGAVGPGETEGNAAAALASPVTSAPEPVPASTASAPRPSGPDARTAGLARVRDLTAAGRYPDAFAALGEVPGLTRNALALEQERLAEHAKERAELARRTASDFRAGATDAFIQGGARLQIGNDHFKAGRMRQAVIEYARARESFEVALSARAAQAGVPAATAAPTVSPAATTGSSPSPSAPAVPTTNAAAASGTTSGASGASGTAPANASMAEWKSEQVQAIVQQFRTYYEQRNITGILRLWPSIDPASERRLRGTFGIPGELQWIPVSQRVVRQQDKATVIASIMNVTPLPGGEPDRRTVNVHIDVAPRGGTLVITSVRQQ
jgi:tetratricopeptide (TPR) repeat protein/predicted Ser/Thr protein kinase